MTSPQPQESPSPPQQSNRHPSVSIEVISNVQCSDPHRSLNLICPQSKTMHQEGQKNYISHTFLICRVFFFLRFPQILWVHLSDHEMRTTQHPSHVVTELLRKPLFSYCNSSFRPSVSHSNIKPLKQNSSFSSSNKEKHSSPLNQSTNSHWAAAAQRKPSCRVLSHQTQLLPHSYIRHLPAECLFANTVRGKHVSHREKNNKTNTRTWGNSTKLCKSQRQELEIALTLA